MPSEIAKPGSLSPGAVLFQGGAEQAHSREQRGEARDRLTLRELRHARHLTQARLAHLLGVRQANVSHIERYAGHRLSTLRGFIEALGGRLRLVAEFPDSQPVAIALTDLPDEAPLTRHRRGHKAAGPPRRHPGRKAQ